MEKKSTNWRQPCLFQEERVVVVVVVVVLMTSTNVWHLIGLPFCDICINDGDDWWCFLGFVVWTLHTCSSLKPGVVCIPTLYISLKTVHILDTIVGGGLLLWWAREKQTKGNGKTNIGCVTLWPCHVNNKGKRIIMEIKILHHAKI